MSPYIPITGNDPSPIVRGTPEPIPGYPSASPLPPPPLHVAPPLTEERFMDAFMLFSNATGVRLSEQAFFIEGRQVNPWELHRIVNARNGFDSVTVNGEWPIIGIDLGFPAVSWGDNPQLAYCSPAVAHQLQQLYQETLRYFDQAYSRGIIDQLGNTQAPGQAPSQPPQTYAQQPLGYQRTEADYQAFATSESESSLMSILPRFWDARSAELEARRVPQSVITLVEQNREYLKLLAQDPRFRGGFTLTPAEGPQVVRQNQLHALSGIQITFHPHPTSLQNLQQRQGQQQQQQPRVDGGLTHGGVMNSGLSQQQQILLALRAQVAQGIMTKQQARERLAMWTASAQSVPQQFPQGSIAEMSSGTAQQQMATLLRHAQVSDSLQRVTQAQDSSYVRQLSMLPPQGQQQQTDTGVASRMGLPQGPGSLRQNFIQPSLSVPPANAQSSFVSSASQPRPPGAQQVSGPSSLANMTLQQLRELFTHIQRIVIEGEKIFQTPSSSGGSDVQRQQLRTKIDNNKRFLSILQEVINAKTTTSDEQAVNGPAQSMSASGIPSMGTRNTGFSSSAGAQNQRYDTPVSPASTYSVRSSSSITQSAGATQIRRLTPEDLIAAKRWVNEKKRMAFNCAPDFDVATSHALIPESDIPEYYRNVDRLDQVLSNIESYIHFAFAVLKREEVVERMFNMMAAVKIQLEELDKLNPRYALELHTIRGMIQEADNMDKGLKAALYRIPTHIMQPDGVPSVLQSPQRLPSMGILPPFGQPASSDPPQRDEAAPSPEGMTSNRESRFEEEVRIAMGKLEIG